MKSKKWIKIIKWSITSLLVFFILLTLIKSIVNRLYIDGNKVGIYLVSKWQNAQNNNTTYLIYLVVFLIGLLCIFIVNKILKLINFKEDSIFKDKNAFNSISKPLLYIIISTVIVCVSMDLLDSFINFIYNNFQDFILVDLWIFLVNCFVLFDFSLLDLIKIIMIIFIYFKLSYKRAKRLGNLIKGTNRIVNGDLEYKINDNNNDEIGVISQNIDDIVAKLKSITEEERKAQKTKSDLITNVSHDLRTPLTAIMGYLSLIDNDKYKDEVQLRYYVSIAHEKSKGLNVLINDLFELTKMQNSSLVLEKKNIDLVELLSQVVAEFQYLFSINNIENRISFCNDKLIINGDPNKIVRVFENLLSNGIKYGKEGHYLDVVARKDENRAVVQVINYGEPILESDIPYIFDRFYRIDKSRNSDKGGSGLGLAIAKNIVELHNGSISVESNYKRTIFKIIFNTAPEID